MKLYHGTCGKHLPAILTSGLKPRSRENQGNYHDSMESLDGFVYLTQTSPYWYAEEAARRMGDGYCVLVECNIVDTSRLFPDEDSFLKHLKIERGKSFRHEDMLVQKQNLRRFGYAANEQALWPALLSKYGNVCFQGEIAPTRYVKLPSRKYCLHSILGLDVYEGISEPDGARQRHLLEILFGQGLKAAIKETTGLIDPSCAAELQSIGDIRANWFLKS